MKFGCFYHPEIDFNFIRSAVEAGLECLEIRYLEDYYPQEKISSFNDNIETLKDMVDLTVHAPQIDINPGSLNSKVRNFSLEYLKETVDYTRKIGSNLLVLHPGAGVYCNPGEFCFNSYFRFIKNKKMEMILENTVETLRKCAEFAPDITFALENLVYPHEIYRSPREMEMLVTEINRPNVKVTLDIGHAAMAGYNPEDYIDLLGSQIVHVHLSDNNLTADEHSPLGEGSIEYLNFMTKLKDELNYSNRVIFEFLPQNPEDYAEIITALKQT